VGKKIGLKCSLGNNKTVFQNQKIIIRMCYILEYKNKEKV